MFVFFLKKGEVFKLSFIKNSCVRNEHQITIRFRELFRKFNLANETSIKTRLQLSEFDNSPQQKVNSNDCGVYVISFIETALKTQNLEDIKDFNMDMYRRYIGKMLLDYPNEKTISDACLILNVVV